MSRRRYISTRISKDKRVNAVAMRSDFAALLYTWLIAHAADDATCSGDPEELLYEVMPGRRDKTAQDVEDALEIIQQEGLFTSRNGRIYFETDTFYKYQTYISKANRRTAANADERRETAEKAASLSLSLSPSIPKDTRSSKPRSTRIEGFDEWWSTYPKKVGKIAAEKAYAKAAKTADAPTLLAGLKSCQFSDERRFIPNPATWLNEGRWLDNEQSAPKPEVCPVCNGTRVMVDADGECPCTFCDGSTE